jgi:hypothetical protein
MHLLYAVVSARFFRSIIRQINGVNISCIANSIFPPGMTLVFARDVNEPTSMFSK